MSYILQLLFAIVIGVIVGSYRSLMKNDYYLDLPNIERGKDNEIISIYVGSLVTYIVFHIFLSSVFIFGGQETFEMVSSFTNGFEIE